MSQMTTTDNNMCVLSANDGVNITIPLNVAKVSITISNMLEDLGDMGQEGEDNIIPVPNVNGAILKKIYTFCDYIYNNPIELQNLQTWLDDKTFTVPLHQWFNDYLNVDQQTMFEVILGSNFLDIQSLLNMQCKYVANIIRNKTPDELRVLFANQSTNGSSATTAAEEEATQVVDA
jgi:S-phase kinase-associated protein 1